MSNSKPTLTIRIGEAAATGIKAQFDQQLSALEAGDAAESMHTLVVADPATVADLLSAESLALLRAVGRHDPPSIDAAAALVDLPVADVEQTLTDLARHNLIELDDHGDRRQPRARYQAVCLDVAPDR